MRDNKTHLSGTIGIDHTTAGFGPSLNQIFRARLAAENQNAHFGCGVLFDALRVEQRLFDQ
jgi:hypothetical protein